MLMGLIAEACKTSMMKNMNEAMKLACSGLVDANPRVRYAGLTCLALLLTEFSPKTQKKFHGDLMPVLIQMMTNESLIKLQTQAVSTVINFVKGLTQEDDEEGSNTTGVLEIYSANLFENLVNLLKKGMNENYEPLQEEVMSLLSVSASLIDKEFAKYFLTLMPMMT